MFTIGLCSITFRQKSINEIVDLCREAGVEAIEWGGDVHVPPGDPAAAETARSTTEAAGLKVCSYGSYYRGDAEAGDFAPVLASARALGAPVIRVWAGRRGSDQADAAYREEVASCLRQAVEAASGANLTVALEYHGGTLTDTRESAHQLLAEVGRPELRLYWQPRTGGRFEDDLTELEAALPHLSHVHVFHWGPDGWQDRRSLAEGRGDWKAYIERIATTGTDRSLIFEFVKDDADAQLTEDVQTLRSILAEVQPGR